MTLARPGHADLAGAIKYDTADIREVPERASARPTAPRVAAGAVCRAAAGGRRRHAVELRGPVGRASVPSWTRTTRWRVSPTAGGSATAWSRRPAPSPTPDAEAAMVAEIDSVIEAGDSIGGSFVVVAEGMPIGVGTNAEWDERLDAALAAAAMGIQAVKGVEIGLGFGVLVRRGSAVHDEVDPDRPSWGRRSNRAGGVEGGMSNGEPIVVRVGVKPVATALRKPLDASTWRPVSLGRAHIERSDVAILPCAAVVGEAMVALVLADQLLTSFGGDTMGTLAMRRRRARSRARGSTAPRGAGSRRAPRWTRPPRRRPSPARTPERADAHPDRDRRHDHRASVRVEGRDTPTPRRRP
ncbi:MAG: chorismate synthase [Chloroflexota bacterium]